MQNTWSVHIVRARAFPAVLAVAVFLLATLCLTAPAPAQAKGYAMPQVDITADVTAAGDVHVVEARTFDFDGSFSSVWWTFAGLPEGANILVNSVSLRTAGDTGDAPDAEARTLQSVPFQAEWRTSGGPGSEAYSWDGAENTLYTFFSAQDASIQVTIDYTVANGAVAYRDVGELYWKYVTADWPVDSQNVTATVTLPVPAGQQVRPGDNVRAWGHGPADGHLDFNDSGQVTYVAPRVKAGQYAEARVVFPADWLSSLPAAARQAHENDSRLETVLADEQTWADSANARRMQDIAFMGIWCALCLAVLAWALAMFLRWGREPKPQFAEKYWRTAPDENLSPAVIGRLMQWNKPRAQQLTATLMELSSKGVVDLHWATHRRGDGTQENDYLLKLDTDAFQATQLDAVEEKAVKFVFGSMAKGKNELWMRDIAPYGKGHSTSFSQQLEAWHATLGSEVARAGLFEQKGASLQRTMRQVAAVCAIVGVAAWGFSGNALVLPPVAATCLMLLVISRFMPRRTQRGADVAAKCEALKRWLCDFSVLDDMPESTPEQWGRLMPYAYALGVQGKAMDALRASSGNAETGDAALLGRVPSLRWLNLHDRGNDAFAAGEFHATVSNAADMVASILSEPAGSGSGGGFSRGGGGGFGGGGGAR